MPAILNKTIGRISERKILIEYWGEGSKDTFNPECKWKSDDRLNVGFRNLIGIPYCLIQILYFIF